MEILIVFPHTSSTRQSACR